MFPPRPVLIVEDDAVQMRLLAEELEAGGQFTAITACSLAEARRILARPDTQVDALLLDVELPDGDGRELCGSLRDGGCNLPVLMLTGSDAEHDVVGGLDLGANDWIAKPYTAAVLLARLRAHLRSYDASMDAVFRIGPYRFQPAMKVLHPADGGRRVLLTDKEVSLLRALLQAKGRSVTRHTLQTEVWGYNPLASTHTLETHVYRLRQKMEARPTEPRILVTSRDGYRLAIEAPGDEPRRVAA